MSVEYPGSVHPMPHGGEPGSGSVPPEGHGTSMPSVGARSTPGALALIAAAVFAIVHASAVVVGIGGDFRTATILAWVAIVGTALTLVMGVVALVRGRGRRWSAAAIILSLVANPLVLTRILVFFEALQS